MGAFTPNLINFAIVAALVGVVFWLVLALRGRGRRIDPACGHCGYRTQGLSSFICPECGSDLREVGIVTWQRPYRPMKIWQALALWLLLSPFAAGAISWVAVEAVSPESKLDFQTVRLNPDRLVALSVLEFYRDQELRRWPWRSTFAPVNPATFTAAGPGLPCLWITGGSTDPQRDNAGPTDVDYVVRNIERAGVTADAQSIRKEAERIVAVLNEAVRTGDLPGAVTAHYGPGAQAWRAPQPVRQVWGIGVVQAVAALLWVLGAAILGLLLLRRKSGLPAHPPAHATA